MTNIDQLKDALAGSDPDPDAVLRSFRGKRARARHRMLAAAGGAAAVVLVVVAGVTLSGANLGGSSASYSSSPAEAAPAGGNATGNVRLPNAGGVPRSTLPNALPGGFSSASGTSSAASCAGVPLNSQLATALQHGGSVIVATGTLTGKAVAASASAGGPPGSTYYAMTLRAVQTLAGPPVKSGSTGWIAGAAKGSAVTPEGQSLWAPDGALFAIVTPASGSGAPVGPVLRVAPVVNGQVIFSDAGCWNTAGLRASPYHGGPLAGLPAPSQTASPYLGAESQGLHAVPLADVEKIAAEAARG